MGSLDDDFDFVAASVERAAVQQRRACRQVLDAGGGRDLALAKHLDLVYDAIETRVSRAHRDPDLLRAVAASFSKAAHAKTAAVPAATG